MAETRFERATIDEPELSRLSDRLDRVATTAAAATYRSGALRSSASGSGDYGDNNTRAFPSPAAQPSPLPYGEQEETEIDLEAVKADILETARRGINVAPHIESRPLVALFKAASAPLPPDIVVDTEKMGYDFYVVEASFSVMLEDDIRLRAATFSIDLSDDTTAPARGVRPVRIFPGRKDIELFKVDISGGVGIDASMNLTVPVDAKHIVPFAELSASAKANLKAGIVAGPYSFAFRRAALEVKGESDPAVSWRYRLEDELTGRNDFKSILVLKVAREATRVDALVTLQVAPFKRWWGLFEKVLPLLQRRRRIPIELTPA